MTASLRRIGPSRGGVLLEPLLVLLRHAGLIRLLALRELRDRHAGSLLGLGWAVLQPVLVFGVLLAAFGHLARGGSAAGAAPLPTDFAHHMLAGFAPWYALAAAVQAAAPVIRANGGLVRQIQFPVAVLPVKAAAAQLPLLLLGLGAALLYQVLVFGHLPPTLPLLLPLLVLHAMLVLGLAWLVAGIGAFVADIDPVLASLSMVALYLLPLFFLPGAAPDVLAPLIAWNPFTPLVAAFQDVLVWGEIRSPGAWAFLAGFAAAAFVAGHAVFAWLQPSFAEAA